MATQDCQAMLMDNAVPDALNGLAGLVGFLLMQCALPEGTRSYLKAFQHFFFMQVLVDICGVGIHMHSYYRCLGVPMEGEFWTGGGEAGFTYRTLMSAGLSFFSSSANLCLVLAVCDSKLSWTSKFPLVFFSVFYLTYFFSMMGPIMVGKPTTWLKSQFPVEMMTFGMWHLDIRHDHGPRVDAHVPHVAQDQVDGGEDHLRCDHSKTSKETTDTLRDFSSQLVSNPFCSKSKVFFRR